MIGSLKVETVAPLNMLLGRVRLLGVIDCEWRAVRNKIKRFIRVFFPTRKQKKTQPFWGNSGFHYDGLLAHESCASA